MTNDQLTAIVAERVMGWTVSPDRFMMAGRRWLPRWRFQPATRLEDAYCLLERAAPQDYAAGAAKDGSFWARVRVAGVTGEAHESSLARAMTLAVIHALGIDIGDVVEAPGQTPSRRARVASRSKRHA